MVRVTVLDSAGKRLSSCPEARAARLVAEGKATWVSQEPPVIRLGYAVALPEPEPDARPVGEGQRLLLHICCGPCATYTVQRLREEGFQVTGHWYNPNIYPAAEHEARREGAIAYAEAVELPLCMEEGDESPAFFQAIAGREQFRVRCTACYRLRLRRTAERAREEGYDAFSTTLLISPYQDQALIRRIGEELAEECGVAFYFENFRRGWAERGRLARQYGLYQQRYCGCVYSERETSEARQERVQREVGRR